MTICVWLDDIREPPNDGRNWLCVKTAAECIALLERSPRIVDVLSLDHDLGEHPDAPENPGTGYDVACWLEERAAHHPGFETLPKRVLCHSANPVGRKRILQALARVYG